MNKPVVISGEASETDSEDESSSTTPKIMTKSVQGAMVTGEDSESENENDASIASAVSALTQTSPDNASVGENKYDSLFHQKLREYNARFNSDIENLCQSTISDASRNLNMVDQQLLRSQLTIQSAVTSLKSLSINSLTVKSKLHSLLSAKFLSNVAVNK